MKEEKIVANEDYDKRVGDTNCKEGKQKNIKGMTGKEEDEKVRARG
jgi:hypothetical protein